MAKTKLFETWTWRLPFPEPFDDPSLSKTSTDVYSRYNSASSKKSTLHGPSLRALLKYAALVNAAENGDDTTDMGAVGHQNDKILVAEYPGSKGRVCAAFVRGTGKFFVAGVDTLGDPPKAYSIGEKEQTGSALFWTLMSAFMEDDEFSEAFSELRQAQKSGFPDIDAAARAAYLLCDNIYRRTENAANLGSSGVKMTIPGTGNLPQLTEVALQNDTYAPTASLYGDFVVMRVGAVPSTPLSVIGHGSFVGQYPLSSRSLSLAEQQLIPALPDWFVIPQEVVRACEHVQKTTGSQNPIRNIMFRGAAGTGKTEAAKAIAAGLNLPYTFLTCSANTEIYDLLGQILPNMDDEGTVSLMREMELPSLEDIRMDPATAYCDMTGEYVEGISEDAVLAKMVELVAEKKGDEPQKNRFTYVETPLIKALRHGYLVEIQEPTVIANPGVLVGLNSLLDRCKSVTLPNGEQVERHPDTVIVVTTNTNYEGCKDLNQSIISRMHLLMDIDEPDIPTTVKRVMGVTGCTDESLVVSMAEVVRDIHQRCRETMITDGSCGIRELIAWVQSSMIIADPFESALYTVISCASGDAENREELINTCLEPKFARKTR